MYMGGGRGLKRSRGRRGRVEGRGSALMGSSEGTR